LSDVVRTVDYSTPATRRSYPTAGTARRELLGPVYPASAGILVERLEVPDALIALDVTATRRPSVAVNGGWARYETLTYSAAVRSGQDLYLSGFAALDLETQEALHPGDVAAQAEVIYESIAHLLSTAGGSVADLVRTTEYVTPGGLDAYRQVAAVRKKALRAPWPASTGAVVAALLRREFLLEVIPTARLGGPLP
jgi:enamine deaminase RidA (YjgF/YER057c/UK114 family)